MRGSQAHPGNPVRSILRRMFGRVNRIGGTRINTEHPLDSAYDTTYGATDYGADRSSGLVADRRAVGNSPGNSLGLGGDR